VLLRKHAFISSNQKKEIRKRDKKVKVIELASLSLQFQIRFGGNVIATKQKKSEKKSFCPVLKL
jgi:starvation-inducible outer membrane lipoprotein